MLNAGITKFKCATIAEAEMLAQCNAPDVCCLSTAWTKIESVHFLIKKSFN
jgi:hypothetical protein